MLTKCPECELQVSDKALTCPHCGYPLSITIRRKRTSKKRMRLPNGFGQISEIKEKRLRKPFRAMIPIGKTETGRPISKIYGYYETYNDAYSALLEYNKNPYSLEKDMNLIDLYEKWSERYFKSLSSEASIRTITSAWNYMKPLWYMSVQQMKTFQIKSCILEANASENIKKRMKSVFNLLFDYALEFEIVDKNPARAFSLAENMELEDKESNCHTVYTDEEIELLWNSPDRWAKVMLIQIYSGWRPQELGLIRIEDVDIENWTFTGGMKTKAGKNRVVPIWSGIRELVKAEYDYSVAHNCEYLFCCDDSMSHQSSNKLTYDKYRHRVQAIMPTHKAHDGRKTFVSLCKRYGVDEYAIKYMVGHAISDITESIYTEREKDWLGEEIEKIRGLVNNTMT